MTDILDTTAAAVAAAAAAPATQADPLAIFATSAKEKEGVSVEVEHPTTGEVLMRFGVARFGGSNSSKIIRIERELKAKLTQGQRRAIDAGNGDPDIVQRMNRQTFVRTTILWFEPVHPALVERYPAKQGAEAHPIVDELFAEYPKMYDVVSELATDEEKYSAAALGDAGNA